MFKISGRPSPSAYIYVLPWSILTLNGHRIQLPDVQLSYFETFEVVRSILQDDQRNTNLLVVSDGMEYGH